MHRRKSGPLYLAVVLLVFAGVVFAAPAQKKTTTTKKTTTAKKTAVQTAKKKTAVSKKTTPATLTRSQARRTRARRSPWTTPTFADSTSGDRTAGDDPVVRAAAVEALGPYNGSIVAVDPSTGRVLTMVNQRVALKSGFQPCSTVKIPVALAALAEGLIDSKTPVRLTSGTRMNLTHALAVSNNPYFANLGVKLGYERFAYYARLFGLGEKAGLNIEGEEPGYFADAPPKNGGMGMMASFGEGITLTPLQLAALLSAICNGGTLLLPAVPPDSGRNRQVRAAHQAAP